MKIRKLRIHDCCNIKECALETFINEIYDKGVKKAFVILDRDTKESLSASIVSELDKINIFTKLFSICQAELPEIVVSSAVKSYYNSNADFIITIGDDTAKDIVNSIRTLISNLDYLNIIRVEAIHPENTEIKIHLNAYYNHSVYKLFKKQYFHQI
jgi:alcohol dehydrogenase class IV